MVTGRSSHLVDANADSDWKAWPDEGFSDGGFKSRIAQGAEKK